MRSLITLFREKTLAITRFSLIAVGGLISIILIFSTAFYLTQSVGYGGVRTGVTFWESTYFTMTTFITIGYGDLLPVDDVGRAIVTGESIISLFYSSAFAGLLAYMLLKKEKILFATKRMYIRLRNRRYYLALKLGNRGNPIVGVKVTLEFLKVTDERIRKRFFASEMRFAIIEKLLYIDFPIQRDKIHAPLNAGIFGYEPFDIRIIVQGTDAVSGENVAFRKYYDVKTIRFGGNYKDVIFKWEKGEPENLKWSNFNKIEKIGEEHIEHFKELRFRK